MNTYVLATVSLKWIVQNSLHKICLFQASPNGFVKLTTADYSPEYEMDHLPMPLLFNDRRMMDPVLIAPFHARVRMHSLQSGKNIRLSIFIINESSPCLCLHIKKSIALRHSF